MGISPVLDIGSAEWAPVAASGQVRCGCVLRPLGGGAAPRPGHQPAFPPRQEVAPEDAGLARLPGAVVVVEWACAGFEGSGGAGFRGFLLFAGCVGWERARGSLVSPHKVGRGSQDPKAKAETPLVLRSPQIPPCTPEPRPAAAPSAFLRPTTPSNALLPNHKLDHLDSDLPPAGPTHKKGVMDGPLEDANGDVAPDWRLVVCSSQGDWQEKPGPQVQVGDPSPQRPAEEAGALRADGSGDGQRGSLEGPPDQSETSAPSGVESLLRPMSFHLSLAQGDSGSHMRCLAEDPVSAVLGPVVVACDSEPSSGPVEQPEAGKGGWAKGVLGPGWGLWATGTMQTHFPSQEPSSSCLPMPTDCLRAQDLSWELLASGMAALPGTRDAEGRAVLFLCAQSPAWLHPQCSPHELLRLLLYLRSIPRPQVQALGLTVLVDARVCAPSISLLQGLCQLQEVVAGALYRVLLVGKSPEEVPAGLQLEQLCSWQSLLTHLSASDLPMSLGGSLPYCHQAWLEFRMRLELLLRNCQAVCALLQGAIESIKAEPLPMESGEVNRLLQRAHVLMQHVLDAPYLAWLQCQGGLELAWLRQWVSEVTLSPDHRPAVDEVDQLYDKVDSLLHQLTLQSNRRVQALELVQTLAAQDRLHQIEVWLQQVGWPALEGPKEPSLHVLLQACGSFQELDQIAQEQIKQGEKVLQPLTGWDAAELGPLGAHFLALQAQLTEFSVALAQRRQKLANADKLSSFFEQASNWAEEGKRVLAELEQEHPKVVLQRLQMHWTKHPDLPPAHFRKMWALATALDSEAIRQECRLAWAQCQDTWLALDQKLEAALKLPRSESTASLFVHRGPTVPPLRKAFSLDRNLGQNPCKSDHCPQVSATGKAQPRPTPVMPLSGSAELRSPNRLQLVMVELVATEREYVRALDYTMDNYFPELDRPDVPQGLRGQRAHLFGNLEKLRDFHHHFFLRELEACAQHPARVAYAFLRHKVQFGMYALYSKNKPHSDALMSSYGNTFFKGKQQALGDHLDLASYLLKPIQRMSKYALLLQELASACGGAGQELSALQAAQSLVRFQLRHGNDLLSMDALQGCDVNLKEQGQLVRQDEFTVRCGRHKSLRRIFLFEDLLLFSKPRRGPSGTDTFTYKRSFKMADLGLTECSGEDNLHFEIWFRRRKARDTFVLQAASLATKQAWTADISRLLWKQAIHNKEVRMAEMASMGVGCKAFWDITPSEEAINNRTIDYVLKCQEVRSRASIAVAPLDSDSPYLGTCSPLPGDPASRSVLGPLNLHLHRDPTLRGLRWSLCSPSFPEEAEATAKLGSQPTLTPEDSEVLSQCPSANGSSGSDSSFVSGQALGRGLEDVSYVSAALPSTYSPRQKLGGSLMSGMAGVLLGNLTAKPE
ncbi:puratrophin-1 [Suncus etruscus]|uniref:puratrophin-1 n=1 Tax=Suncus etruscus TaxID=109475 RepID=UPI00210F7049|nr:puratrophin-1 [Suncus etruscus]